MTTDIPPKIGKYFILLLLGSGSCGSVYLGQDPVTNEKVAVKKINKISMRDIISNQEVKMMRAYTRHPHLIYLIEKIDNFPAIFFVMNYVGQDNLLTHVNREGPFPENKAKTIFEQMLSGLEHLHNAGVVHRDIKAENILFTPELSPVICDLGFATQWSKKKQLKRSCGSLHYAAPEILDGKSYIGPEIDIWSLGVVLYAMVAGTLPWSGQREEVIIYVRTGDYWLWDFFPPPLIALLDGMMEPSPTKRFTIERIKQTQWYKERENGPQTVYEPANSVSTVPTNDQVMLNINSLTDPRSSVSSGLFASGRRSGRSLYSSCHSSAASVKSIEKSPRFSVQDEDETPDEYPQQTSTPTLQVHSSQPATRLQRSLSGVGLQPPGMPLSIGDQEEEEMDLRKIPNWSVDLGEIRQWDRPVDDPRLNSERDKSLSKPNSHKTTWKNKLQSLKTKLKIGPKPKNVPEINVSPPKS